jgi:hypothetical protein
MPANARLATVVRKAIRFTAVLLVFLLELSTDDNAYQRTKSSRSRAAIKESKLCQFPFADGRRCRMLRHPGHPCLCLFHARAEPQLVETGNFGSELAQTISGDFNDGHRHQLRDGPPLYRRRAGSYPYSQRQCSRVGRIMLGTVPGIKTEFPFSYKFEDWNKILDATEGLLTARPPLRLPPRRRSLRAAARRSHIHHTNTTQTRHCERREESLFAFDFCRTSQLTAAESGETSTADAAGQ